MTANGRHLALSGRRGTPPDWVEMSRAALGGRIELDPMSEPVFNEIVRAERIYTEQDDCFSVLWQADTLFINPHGGLVVEAWRELSRVHRCGYVKAAIWIGFSMEQLNLLVDEVEHPMDFSMLTVRKRIDFLTTEPMRDVVHRSPETAMLECGHQIDVVNAKQRKAKSLRCPYCEGAPEALGAPTHGNYVVGLGIPGDRFEAAFAGRGRFSHGQFAVARAGLLDEEAFGGVA